MVRQRGVVPRGALTWMVDKFCSDRNWAMFSLGSLYIAKTKAQASAQHHPIGRSIFQSCSFGAIQIEHEKVYFFQPNFNRTTLKSSKTHQLYERICKTKKDPICVLNLLPKRFNNISLLSTIFLCKKTSVESLVNSDFDSNS